MCHDHDTLPFKWNAAALTTLQKKWYLYSPSYEFSQEELFYFHLIRSCQLLSSCTSDDWTSLAVSTRFCFFSMRWRRHPLELGSRFLYRQPRRRGWRLREITSAPTHTAQSISTLLEIHRKVSAVTNAAKHQASRQNTFSFPIKTWEFSIESTLIFQALLSIKKQ